MSDEKREPLASPAQSGRGQHDALDALTVGLWRKKVNRVLDLGMFLRPNHRSKDGKEHTYWSLAISAWVTKERNRSLP